MHICACSSAPEICQNIGIRTYFGSVTAASLGVFRHFAFCIKVPRLATFFIASKNCIFWGLLLSSQKIWQLWVLKSCKVLMRPPYPIIGSVTPYHLLLRQGWVLFAVGMNVRIQWDPVYKAFHRILSCEKRTNCSVAIQTWSWRGKPAASSQSGLREANAER